MITIKNSQRTISINRTQLHTDVEKLLNTCGYANFDIGILITTNRTIQRYNKQFRNKDMATDVLSFPYHTTAKPTQKIIAKTAEERNLGDIIISAAYVQRVAQEMGIPFYQHLQRMLVHGMCHLFGYTHETEKDHQLMESFEEKLLKTITPIR